MSELKYAMVVDKDGFVVKDNKNHKIFVLVKITNYEGVEKETLESYTLQESNSLIYKNWDIANSMISPQWNGKIWVETGKVEITPEMVETLRISKLKEISGDCQNTIVAGVDVETLIGIEHFSLDDRDQKNITALSIAIAQAQMGIPGDINLEKGVLYHSDDNACRFFSANELAALTSAATKYVTYQTTYHNHLKVYVKRIDDYGELKSVAYGMNLPEDLQSSMALLLGMKG